MAETASPTWAYKSPYGGRQAAGIALLLSGIYVQAAGWDPGWMVALAGLVLALFRRGITIDNDGSLRLWRGLLVPMISEQYAAAGFTAVELGVEVRRHSFTSQRTDPLHSTNAMHGVSLCYVVRLIDAHGATEADQPASYDLARRCGEKLAKALDVPLIDTCWGDPQVRDAGTMDESLADRLRRTGTVPTPGAAPAGMRARVAQQADRLQIFLPRLGFSTGTRVMLILGLTMVAVLPANLWLRSSGRQAIAPTADVWLFGAGIVGALMTVYVVNLVFTQFVIRASVTQVMIVEKRILGLRRWNFPAAALEDVRSVECALPIGYEAQQDYAYIPRRLRGGLLFRSDTQTTVVGHDLPLAERAYLQDVLQAFLAQPAAG